ncbi:MAG: hypothetical protein JXQ30_00625 [Spirochaetes bacterium]|nr:hypothetical protein [Spirochaetota bacterium]
MEENTGGYAYDERMSRSRYDTYGRRVRGENRDCVQIKGPCAINSRGNYGRIWICPPGTGSLKECEKVYSLHGSFGIEGMEEAHEDFFRLVMSVRETIPEEEELPDTLLLGPTLSGKGAGFQIRRLGPWRCTA